MAKNKALFCKLYFTFLQILDLSVHIVAMLLHKMMFWNLSHKRFLLLLSDLSAM